MIKTFFEHTRIYMFRGLLAIIPILLCYFAIQLLYVLIDKRIMGFLEKFIEIRKIPGLGILLLLISLYFIGLLVSNFMGRQFLKFIEKITERIPLVKTIYGIGKQLSQSLSSVDSDKQAFKKAVLIKLNDDKLMVPAFVTGTLKSQETNEEYFFVLAPTAPTPGSGFALVVKASQIVDPGWTVEECLKAVVSVGIVAPKEIKGQMAVPKEMKAQIQKDATSRNGDDKK
ncbi:MAG: DUF502 domain-containing protein [Candidatus Omnitrophica bacterium]|nr:DUF502 domain-containing protein [Candidatus Omnitrophota bacterium]